MNQKLSFQHSTEQKQQLNLAPQLLQWLRVLQLSSQNLEQMVRTELETNPALETETDEQDNVADTLEPCPDDDPLEMRETTFDETVIDEKYALLAEIDNQWSSTDAANGGSIHSQNNEQALQEKHEYKMNSLQTGETLHDCLRRQLAATDITPQQRMLAEHIIGAINQKGYLAVDLENLAEEAGCPSEIMEAVLKKIQECEPCGVAARDLRECLLLQIKGKSSTNNIARIIVADYLEAVANGCLTGISRKLGISESTVNEVVAFIKKLNPAPGLSMDECREEPAVLPDIKVILTEAGTLETEILNQRIPRLRISRSCRELIQRGNLSEEEANYVRERIRAASFLIEGIKQRQHTLRRIADEITRVQKSYLTAADNEIRPMTMSHVAAMLGVHETTISRALAGKNMETPRGFIPMRDFFRSGYHCDDGSALTPVAVSRKIRKMIQSETAEKPLKDEDISILLRGKGIPVARRTVAKYRKQQGIPSSKVRASQYQINNERRNAQKNSNNIKRRNAA